MAGKVCHTHGTFVRSLLFDYAKDPVCADIHDEYLFGDSILVCPVLRPMYYDRGGTSLTSDHIRRLYLPAGNDWIDFYTGEKHVGGQWIERVTPLEEFPVYVKAGSIIPMAEGLQYAAEYQTTKECKVLLENVFSQHREKKKKKTVEYVVYPGADADFEYYEDAGEGYAYEQGEYSFTHLHWDDKTQSMHMS